jgi:hypothetical protein
MKPRSHFASALLIAAVPATGTAAFAQQRDPAAPAARRSPEWLKSGVIPQAFVPSFLPSGEQIDHLVLKLEPDDVPFVYPNSVGARIFQEQAR